MNNQEVIKALDEIRKGRILVITDGQERKLGSGLLLLAAEKATDRDIEILMRHGGRRFELALMRRQFHDLGIPATGMAGSSSMRSGALTLSFNGDAPVAERTRWLRSLARPEVRLDPKGYRALLEAAEGNSDAPGEEGHLGAAVTEAILAMMEDAELPPVAVCSRMVDASGASLALEQVRAVASEHRLLEFSLDQLLEVFGTPLLSRKALARLPTVFGDFTAVVYEASVYGAEHMALVMGGIDDGEPVLVRLHSECLTGDVLGSLRCDCGPQLELALKRIAEEGRGALLYLRQEGRGIGLFNKMRAYGLQDEGLDTVEANWKLGFPADMRDFRIAARILTDLGVSKIRLLTNNVQKISVLEEHGVEVVERVPLITESHEANQFYLETKRKRLGHLLPNREAQQGGKGKKDLGS